MNVGKLPRVKSSSADSTVPRWKDKTRSLELLTQDCFSYCYGFRGHPRVLIVVPTPVAHSFVYGPVRGALVIGCTCASGLSLS